MLSLLLQQRQLLQMYRLPATRTLHTVHAKKPITKTPEGRTFYTQSKHDRSSSVFTHMTGTADTVCGVSSAEPRKPRTA
jgi:hypothetical protein